MLSELRSEREQIEEAILTLERLAMGSGKRRGRPPAWMSRAKKSRTAAPNEKTRKKRVINAEARARMAAAQKRRWATAREAQTKAVKTA